MCLLLVWRKPLHSPLHTPVKPFCHSFFAKIHKPVVNRSGTSGYFGNNALQKAINQKSRPEMTSGLPGKKNYLN